jgi:vacuolar-type H+-ATPase subunit H
MTNRQVPVDGSSADAAIDRVLDAEAAARGEINECRRQALAILREARSRARAISQRADRRIGQVRRLSDAALKSRLDAIAEQSRALSDPPRLTAELESRLDEAIERMIGEILE